MINPYVSNFVFFNVYKIADLHSIKTAVKLIHVLVFKIVQYDYLYHYFIL